MVFRGLGIVLLNYGKLYSLQTIDQIFDRYPPLNLRTHANLISLMKAIATAEAGHRLFTDTDLSDGAALAID